MNSSYAVGQDATGRALERTLAIGIGIGSGYLFETTFQREAISDLTGERGSLMGAIQGLFQAQFEVLRENGHTPSEAFNETVEELTQSLMPLFADRGMDWMYANCSTTAQRGALDWMTPFHDAVKPVLQRLYESVRTGNEAQISIDSNSRPDYRAKLEEEPPTDARKRNVAHCRDRTPPTSGKLIGTQITNPKRKPASAVQASFLLICKGIP